MVPQLFSQSPQKSFSRFARALFFGYFSLLPLVSAFTFQFNLKTSYTETIAIFRSSIPKIRVIIIIKCFEPLLSIFFLSFFLLLFSDTLSVVLNQKNAIALEIIRKTHIRKSHPNYEIPYRL